LPRLTARCEAFQTNLESLQAHADHLQDNLDKAIEYLQRAGVADEDGAVNEEAIENYQTLKEEYEKEVEDLRQALHKLAQEHSTWVDSPSRRIVQLTGSAAEKIAGLEDKVARQEKDLEGAAVREESSQEAADEVPLLRTRVVEVEEELKAEKGKVEALERGDQTMGKELQVSIPTISASPQTDKVSWLSRVCRPNSIMRMLPRPRCELLSIPTWSDLWLNRGRCIKLTRRREPGNPKSRSRASRTRSRRWSSRSSTRWATPDRSS
jgi:DNA repair exonuclease SbcCD ATPase subunit